MFHRAFLVGCLVAAAPFIATPALPGQSRQLPPTPSALPGPPGQSGRSVAPADPVTGNWRGTLKSSAGTETPIIITITRKGDVYAASTNGLNAPSEIPVRRVSVTGNRVTLEASAESRLGDVVLAAVLTAEGTALKGTGTLA